MYIGYNLAEWETRVRSFSLHNTTDCTVARLARVVQVRALVGDFVFLGKTLYSQNGSKTALNLNYWHYLFQLFFGEFYDCALFKMSVYQHKQVMGRPREKEALLVKAYE